MGDEIKRYNPIVNARFDGVVQRFSPEMNEYRQGEWVRWSDVKESLAELDVRKNQEREVFFKEKPEIINVFKVYLNLYKNGDACVFNSKIDAQRAPLLLPERQKQLIETRLVEWEVKQ